MNKDIPGNDRQAPKQSDSDQQIIDDAKQYLELCNGANSQNVKEGLIDLQYLVGNHWPEKQKRQRELDGRPCLTVNKLPTFLNQVTNDQRQNRTSIKVSPVGDGADIDVAEVYQGMIKHIEYASNADIATDTAVGSAAAIGFGFYRIMPQYCSEDSFDQELAYKRIRNAFTVSYDPGSIEPDGSDQQRCLIHVDQDVAAFKQEYPHAQVSAAALALDSTTSSATWLTDKYIRVGEFYRIERTRAELVQLSDGAIHWKDEMPSEADLLAVNVKIVNTRWSFKKRVMWYKLTAIEILERTEIKCDWIPVFPVFGSEIDLDGKVIRKGVIRDARDPSLMYDYYMTSATEEDGTRNKVPYIGAEGQFEGHPEWQDANVRNYATLEYKPVSLEGQLAPPPQRQPMADIPQGMLAMAMHANDNIKATTGLFDSSLGAAGNATSGKQELAQQHQGSIANFHYQDGLTRTRRHDARCILNMIPHYYDSQRIVQIMRDDDKIESVEVNKPLGPEEQQEEMEARKAKAPEGQEVAIKEILNDLTLGKYAVAVDTGPSYSTMRKEAADSMIQFGQSWPKLMDVAGDKVVQAMDWPGAQGIAERIKRIIPAEVLYDPNDPKAGPPPIPPELKQQMDQMQQALQEATDEIKKLESGIDKENIKAETARLIAQSQQAADERIATQTNQTKLDVEEIKGYIKLIVEKLNPPEILESEANKDMVK